MSAYEVLLVSLTAAIAAAQKAGPNYASTVDGLMVVKRDALRLGAAVERAGV